MGIFSQERVSGVVQHLRAGPQLLAAAMLQHPLLTAGAFASSDVAASATVCSGYFRKAWLKMQPLLVLG